MLDLYRDFENYVGVHHLFNKGDKVIVGVSGGADSMCLLILLCEYAKKADLKLTCVHVNHMIRGEEADADEEFVKAYCKALNVPCVGVKADVPAYAEAKGISLEEAGRTARYRTFLKVARMRADNDGSLDSVKVAVAHHMDDNAETIVLNLLRGSGLKGLSGIQPVSEMFGMTVVRPLLCVTRDSIEGFLSENNVQYRTDSTNLADDYSRNKIRLNVMPLLKELNPKAVQHINEAASDIRDADEFINSETDKTCRVIVDKRSEGYYLNLERLKYLSNIIQGQVVRKIIGRLAGSLKDISRVHVADVLSLMNKQTGKYVELPYEIVALRSYSNIILRKATDADKKALNMAGHANMAGPAFDMKKEVEKGGEEEKKKYRIDINLSEVTDLLSTYELWDDITVDVQKVEVNVLSREFLTEKNKYTKTFDCDKIKGNLVVRRPAPDDEIKFFGGTKTVKKFFVDQKVPQEERRKALVLVDDETVLWIIGYRISEDYKLTDSTTNGLKISISGGIYEGN